MKKVLILASAVAGLISSSAIAQSAPSSVTGTVTINGNVAARCLFTTASEVITIPELSDLATGGLTGKLAASTVNGQTKKLAGWCNGAASTMTVTSTALTNTVPAPNSSFDNRVDYKATAVTSTGSAFDSSVGALSSGSASTVAIFTGDIEVTLSDASSPNTGVLVAGAYQGHVDVTLSPAL
jgi:hypothetical protein